jgi:hypothetical protein
MPLTCGYAAPVGIVARVPYGSGTLDVVVEKNVGEGAAYGLEVRRETGRGLPPPLTSEFASVSMWSPVLS